MIDHCQFPSSLSSRGCSRYLRVFTLLRLSTSLLQPSSACLRAPPSVSACSRPLILATAVGSPVFASFITELQFISRQKCKRVLLLSGQWQVVRSVKHEPLGLLAQQTLEKKGEFDIQRTVHRDIFLSNLMPLTSSQHNLYTNCCVYINIYIYIFIYLYIYTEWPKNNVYTCYSSISLE